MEHLTEFDPRQLSVTSVVCSPIHARNPEGTGFGSVCPEVAQNLVFPGTTHEWRYAECQVNGNSPCSRGLARPTGAYVSTRSSNFLSVSGLKRDREKRSASAGVIV